MAYANVLTDTYVSVEHLSPDSDNANKEGYLSDAALVAVACNIQPTSPQIALLYGGAYGKLHTIFTTQSGILETDRVTQSGTGVQYIVKGKQLFNYGMGQHSEYIIEKVL